ncbi:hypothetical protein HLB23_24360 [Nocardia uniformis]|uniref:Rv3651-like N-terminal domain-containing protein n=1 Tax=Nocardia uniformis TaxID=53432 RepID=A0A849C2R4_9NOCA|nr:GAF domain-containing protein [Nocardia uniformis]NNH72954.1 hypothetical protein [Nocardia uniformis]
MAETLSGIDHASVVLDGPEAREFSKLTRSSVAANGLVARELDGLVHECATVHDTCSKYITLPDGQKKRIAAIPKLGPTGHVHAAAIWVDSVVNGDLPESPVVGTMEWSVTGVVIADPAAHYLLRLPYGELPHGNTIPELLARFDQWDDRAKFLSMFNLVDPTDQWIGTATTTYEDGTDHQLHFAARASGLGADRTIRAIVFGATDQSVTCTDPRTLGFRQMPIPSGHALALVDLPSGFVHEWLAKERTSLAGWRHHQPEFDYNSRLLAAETCFALAVGARRESKTQARLRFSPSDEWMVLDATWTRIRGPGRPQALIDITPVSPNPVPLISGCRICQDLVHAAWGSEFDSPVTE